jgi:hypothetical protein
MWMRDAMEMHRSTYNYTKSDWISGGMVFLFERVQFHGRLVLAEVEPTPSCMLVNAQVGFLICIWQEKNAKTFSFDALES